MSCVRRIKVFAYAAILLGCVATASAARAAQAAQDNDQTLRAMRDEMARSKARLELSIPGTQQPVRPYYVEYRLVDLDFREIVAEFGALVTTTRARNRFMNVEARVGSYKRDSSNFISDDAFRGFIGSQGSVGIDRDYDSLRQDLWIATDQAFKQAVETYSRKEAHGFYWTATENDSTAAWYYNFGKGSLALYQQDGGEKKGGFSVRCVNSIKRK